MAVIIPIFTALLLCASLERFVADPSFSQGLDSRREKLTTPHWSSPCRTNAFEEHSEFTVLLEEFQRKRLLQPVPRRDGARGQTSQPSSLIVTNFSKNTSLIVRVLSRRTPDGTAQGPALFSSLAATMQNETAKQTRGGRPEKGGTQHPQTTHTHTPT